MKSWLAELDGRRILVEVPASAANLGAGYDCLALALDLVNRIELEVRGWSRGEVDLSVDGEGAGELPSDRTNRFVRALESILTEVRGELPVGAAWGVEMRNKIPLARGLGSSAAATVGGLVAGNALLGEPLTNRELLRLATEIEGHPDNAAAALLGGFTVVGPSNGGVEALRFDAPRDLRLCSAVSGAQCWQLATPRRRRRRAGRQLPLPPSASCPRPHEPRDTRRASSRVPAGSRRTGCWCTRVR